MSHAQSEAPEASHFGIDAELVIKTVSIVPEEPKPASTPQPFFSPSSLPVPTEARAPKESILN